MDQILYIFILFNILFVIETKAINILFSFVGIIITLAIKIGTMNNISPEYYSYILILVQVSALTILFGFIIMLYPSSANTMIPSTSENSNNWFQDTNTLKGQFILKSLKLGFFISLFIIIYFILHNIYPLSGGLKYESVINTFSMYLDSYIHPISNNPSLANTIDVNIQDKLTQGEIIVEKLGLAFYTDYNNILKLFLITIILLLAIIALFYLNN